MVGAPEPPARRGGEMGSKEYRFEITGGSLCLDLANTVDERPTRRPRELLPDYEALLAWSRQAQAITPRQATQMRKRARLRPGEAAAVVRRVRALREDLFSLFSALAALRLPPPETLERVNGNLPGAMSRLRLVRKGREFAWDWMEDPALDRMVWPVLRSAAQLLTSPQCDRIRECASDRCAWLFLDQSRNRSRRWCDMTVCGNRDKSRRHYVRTKRKKS